MAQAANYSARRITVDGVEVIRLADASRQTEVSIVPSIGNNAYEMTVKGRNIFFTPHKSPAELRAKPAQLGNPFLAPWANRLDQDAFFANGKKYLLNPELKNYRYDGNRLPIHGLLVYASEWQVVSMGADAASAHVTSRLEFWKRPDWMAQFPFAHAFEMTYRLKEGTLEVETVVENLSSDPMPLIIGYHPYYRLHDSARDEWRVRIGASEIVKLSAALTPTGEFVRMDLPQPFSLKGNKLDDVFKGLVRDARGYSEFTLEGTSEKLTFLFGPKYNTAVVYAPPGREFVCFEPMTGITNAMSLAHQGKYNELQSVAPGQKWKESFFIRPSGF
jgi:aldose 1-epimerase